MASPRAPTEELNAMRAEEFDIGPQYAGGDPEQNAGGDPEPHHATSMWYGVFASALKTFTRLMTQSLTNIRGMAVADVDGLGNDPDLLCQLGTSFFKQTADNNEIE